MVALDFNDAGAHGAAGSAALFEFRGQRFEIGGGQGQTRNSGDSLARPALSLARNPHSGGLGSSGNPLGAYALAHRPPAVRAQAADAGRVHNSRAHDGYVTI